MAENIAQYDDTDIAKNITMAELSAFFAEKGVDDKCRMCSKGKYRINGSDDKPAMTAKQLVANPVAAYWFFSLYCDNCFHNQDFLVPAVVESVKQQRSKGDGG